MFGLVRTSLRFFVLGFIAGTLFAPRAGEETRAMLTEKLRVMANQILEIAALPPIEAEHAGSNGGEAPRGRRSGAARGGGARASS
jgi:hypothetical protein